MSAFGNIALTDGETSPVTHTFVPNGFAASGVANWINRNASVPAASESVSLTMKKSSSSVEDISTPGRKVSPDRIDRRIKLPITYVDGVSGLTLVDYVNEVVTTYFFHPRSAEQSRKNARFLDANLYSIAQIYNAVDKHESVY